MAIEILAQLLPIENSVGFFVAIRGIMKRAAIYVRVSSEVQAEKASPQAQEDDCRQYAEQHGYSVVKIYKDIAKYRVNGRLVEPSGSRHDRPQLKRMLVDCDADKFDVLIAWREDRLYRGISRATIEIRDRVKAGDLDVEVVNGHFDIRTAEILAWAAGVELEAKRDRYMMGMAARFADGKVALSNPVYGYDYDKKTGTLSVNETEAHWVRQIWEWYADGVSRYEIRRRLIGADAPQNATTTVKRKHKWSVGVIDKIVGRDDYFTGIFTTKWGGKEYESEIPTLIDEKTYKAVKRRKAKWKAHPTGNLKSKALLAGLMYCKACGCAMGCRRTRVTRHMKKPKIYRYYYCYNYARRTGQPNCAISVRMDIADHNVWSSLYSILTEPGRFEEAISERIRELDAKEQNTQAELEQLSLQLDEILMERQRVITWARKGTITESDLEAQLLSIDMQKRLIEQEISERSLLLNGQAGQLVELAEIFRQNVNAHLTALAPDAPTTEEQFKLKRKFVDALIQRVDVHGDKALEIAMEAGLSSRPEFRDDSLLTNQLDLQAKLTDQQKFYFVVTSPGQQLIPKK